jgi:hypothetical protein
MFEVGHFIVLLLSDTIEDIAKFLVYFEDSKWVSWLFGIEEGLRYFDIGLLCIHIPWLYLWLC